MKDEVKQFRTFLAEPIVDAMDDERITRIIVRGRREFELVRHGKWKIKAVNTFELAYGTTGYEPVYQCSVCGGVEESYLRLDEPIMPEDADFPKYCPHCGAKMDEVEE